MPLKILACSSSLQKLLLGFCQETIIGNDSVTKGGGRKRQAVGRVVGVPSGLMNSKQFLSFSPSLTYSLSLSLFFFSYLFLLGLQQQGIFRVPGSQVEVNDIKNSFERGKVWSDHLISSLSPEEDRAGVNTCLSTGCWVAFIDISSQFHLQRLHLGSLRSGKVGVFTP